MKQIALVFVLVTTAIFASEKNVDNPFTPRTVVRFLWQPVAREAYLKHARKTITLEHIYSGKEEHYAKDCEPELKSMIKNLFKDYKTKFKHYCPEAYKNINVTEQFNKEMKQLKKDCGDSVKVIMMQELERRKILERSCVIS